MSADGDAHLMKLETFVVDYPDPVPDGYFYDWQWQWGNNGNSRIALRQLWPWDNVLAGNYYRDGKDALFVVHNYNLPTPGTGKRAHMIQSASFGTWQFMREDVSSIALWNMGLDDRYLTGNFLGDGGDNLLAISPSTGWAHLMTLQGP